MAIDQTYSGAISGDDDSLFSGLLADGSGTATFIVELTLSAFNEVLDPIVAPKLIAQPAPAPTHTPTPTPHPTPKG